MVDTHDIELPVFEHWSTADTTDDTIGDRWAQIRRHSYTDVATDPVLPGFYGDVALGRYTNFTLSTKRANAEDARRSATRIARGHDADEYLFATFQIRGSCLIEQADHTHLAAPGRNDQDLWIWEGVPSRKYDPGSHLIKSALQRWRKG
ncbi:hypothetical protein, partial [Gordonia jinhuaensis]